MTDTRFDPFQIYDFTYKTISNTPIETSVLVPKTLSPGKYPVLVRWHGGYLITGARKYAKHLHRHVLDFALQNSAIIVNPDYRLFPEATGNEILDDISDFWTWRRRDFVGEMERLGKGVVPDVDDILVQGESAGGYLAIQSALLHPEMNFKAVVAAYPTLDVTSPSSRSRMEDVVSADESLSHSPLMLTIINEGRYFEFLSRRAESEEEIARVQPIRNLERVETSKISFLFVYHGRQDTGVPVEGTQIFEKRIRELHQQAKARFVYEEGEHGFDRDASLETGWLKKGLEEVGRHWPAESMVP